MDGNGALEPPFKLERSPSRFTKGNTRVRWSVGRAYSTGKERRQWVVAVQVDLGKACTAFVPVKRGQIVWVEERRGRLSSGPTRTALLCAACVSCAADPRGDRKIVGVRVPPSAPRLRRDAPWGLQALSLRASRSAFGHESPLPHHTSNPAQYRGFSSLGAIFVHRLSTNTKALGSPREAARLWSARFVVAAGPHLPLRCRFCGEPTWSTPVCSGRQTLFRDRGRRY